MTTGQRIRQLRLAAKLTQEQCAIRLGAAGRSSWSDIEVGRHSPTVGMLERIAAVLGCKVSVIFTRTRN